MQNSTIRGCFIILNYINYKITQKAVKYLKKLKGIDDHIIVIFDNGSNNDSKSILQNKYVSSNNIIVDGYDENLGFSEGNNAAYKLALKYNPTPGFVVSMNSDVFIKQKDFISKIEDYILENKYYIVGPSVFGYYTKEYHSPLFLNIPSQYDIDFKINHYKSQLANIDNIQNKQRISKTYIKAKMPRFIIELWRRICRRQIDDKYVYRRENVVLSGCCVIYLKKYLQCESVLFEPDTFLYGEEILLALKCKSYGYSTLYDPSLEIEHHESVSIKTDSASYKQFIKKESTRMIHAFEIVKECMNNNPWEKLK